MILNRSVILTFTVFVIGCLSIKQFNSNDRFEQRNFIQHSLSPYKNSIVKFWCSTDAFLLFFANWVYFHFQHSCHYFAVKISCCFLKNLILIDHSRLSTFSILVVELKIDSHFRVNQAIAYPFIKCVRMLLLSPQTRII